MGLCVVMKLWVVSNTGMRLFGRLRRNEANEDWVS